jgi:hypothetical protein
MGNLILETGAEAVDSSPKVFDHAWMCAAYGDSSPKTVGTSSETVGWIAITLV